MFGYSIRRPVVGISIIIFMLVVSALACGNLSGEGGESTGPDPDAATLTLTNNSGEPICYVYISPITDDAWGDNWLDSTEVIPDGESRDFSVSRGDYNLRADDCSNNEIETVQNVPLSGYQTWTVVPGQVQQDGGATLTLVNNSGQTVCHVYISLTTDEPWGDDWLGSSGAISDGESRDFSVAPGDYNLRADDCANNEINVVQHVPISDSRTWTIAPGEEHLGDGSGATLTVTNNSGETICFVYISPVTDAYWGDDWLGSSDAIADSESRDFSVAPGDYDLRVDDCSSNEINVAWGMSISGHQTWTVTPSLQRLGGDATLTLVNNSSDTICFVYISPVTDSTWGSDWLGSTETISPGASRSFSLPSGDYDLRADDCSHNEIDIVWNMSISGNQTWTAP